MLGRDTLLTLQSSGPPPSAAILIYHETFFRQRLALIVYRLIHAALTGSFFRDPFLFKNSNFGNTASIVTVRQLWVREAYAHSAFRKI